MPVADIRPYTPADLPAMREVCLRTAAAGGDATGMYSTDELMPDLFCEPYLLLEPELASVIETATGVAGYIIGTADTRAFVERYEREWMPRLATRYQHVDPPHTAEQRMLHLGFTPRRMLIPEVDEYPAHLHIDLLPEVQGQGLGRALIDRLRSQLAGRGIHGLHLTMDAANTGARAFYDRLGFTELPSSTPEAPVLGISTGP